MNILKRGCKKIEKDKICNGDIQMDYKADRPGGSKPKCLKCSRYGVGILLDESALLNEEI
tara:strand:- start:500 stop:679 length:180 start_codon:yes stop_codon:yes gene_type:complete